MPSKIRMCTRAWCLLPHGTPIACYNYCLKTLYDYCCTTEEKRIPCNNANKTCVSFFSRQRSAAAGGGGGSYSGKGYDRWAYEQATPGSNDSPLNKLQKKFWITKQVIRGVFFTDICCRDRSRAIESCANSFFLLLKQSAELNLKKKLCC